MENISKIVGERIRNYRNKAKLSQEALAEKAGLHNTYIGQVERGEKNATLESIEKIVIALDISFEELFKNLKVGDMKDIVPSNCYDTILKLPQQEQIAMYELINKIIEYKNL